MFRTLSFLTLLFALAICSPAQVTVTNQGFATTSGPAVPATPVSPPILYAPVVRLEGGPTQPIEAVPGPPETEAQSSQPQAQQPQAFNFGVAQFDTPILQGGVGQPINGMSLGEFARQQRQKQSASGVKTYTNSDIQGLRQPASVNDSTQGGKTDNWVPNNGVIDPNGVSPQPSTDNTVGAPAGRQPQRPNSTPFGPKSPSVTPRLKPKAEIESADPVEFGTLEPN
jgi:hypothetical protein